jgi:tetratricopeptide (TPR) repeat protein
MELSLKPHLQNIYPLRAILIRGSNPTQWLSEIQRMELQIQQISIYALPGNTANSISGCMVVTGNTVIKEPGMNELLQQAGRNLFISGKAILHPFLAEKEIEKIFHTNIHLFHPLVGLVELHEPLDLRTLIDLPKHRELYVTRPQKGPSIPSEIKAFQIRPVSPEEALKKMEEKAFPKTEKMPDKPLGLFEKGLLQAYKSLFTRKKAADGSENTESTPFMKNLEGMVNSFTGKGKEIKESLQQKYEDLEERNKKEVDKLLDLLKNNPKEALKYAPPLDMNGSSRGEGNLPFSLSRRWPDLSIFGGGFASSGSVDLGDQFHTLQDQYRKTAEEFLANKEYHNAAFIYLKLLKDPNSAANALEQGELHQEAAAIYLKAGMKTKAAECYEKGRMTEQAIEIYKELQQNEKVGDLYKTIGRKKEAIQFYEKVVTEYSSKNQFVKAALLARTKMEDEESAQILLMQGWQKNSDAVSCLSLYLDNIRPDHLRLEIEKIYDESLFDENAENFVRVLSIEHKKRNELQEWIKDVAYTVIAEQIKKNPSIVSEMRSFNKNDGELLKDTIRFKSKRK